MSIFPHRKSALYFYSNQLYCSTRDIDSEVCKKYADAALSAFWSDKAGSRTKILILKWNIQKIKEFEDVLCSFANMKDNLKISLEKQWNAEQLQREQIAALAHDLKTPLTVIQGNIDLINETELDDEQRLYAGYITESSEQIGIYIKALIDISRTIAGYQLHLEKFDIADYMGQIKAQASSLCLTKGICLQLETGANLGTLKADKLLLERAIMNVISNALDYSPPQGTIYVTVQKRTAFYIYL